MYAAADRMLGHIVKVTPSSKVVGDLALHLVGAGVDPAEFEADPGRFDIPDSVIGFLPGELGDPPGGWPEPFRTKALAGRAGRSRRRRAVRRGRARRWRADPRRDPEPAAVPRRRPGSSPPTASSSATRPRAAQRTTSTACGPARSTRSTCEQGVRLLIGLEAIGEADERGMRTVMSTLNGQLRPIQVRDRVGRVDVPVAEKAEPGNPGQVAAPFAGVVTLAVAEGDEVEAGADRGHHRGDEDGGRRSPRRTPARSARLAINSVQQVEGGDLLRGAQVDRCRPGSARGRVNVDSHCDHSGVRALSALS